MDVKHTDPDLEAVLRPLFAAVAMHALLPAAERHGWGPGEIAKVATNFADALLARLREETP